MTSTRARDPPPTRLWTNVEPAGEADARASSRGLRRRPGSTAAAIALVAGTTLGAGALASWLTAPLDLAKLRVQVYQGATGPSFLRALVDASKAGPRGLFRGAGARVLFSAPSMGASMACFEQAKSLLL